MEIRDTQIEDIVISSPTLALTAISDNSESGQSNTIKNNEKKFGVINMKTEKLFYFKIGMQVYDKLMIEVSFESNSSKEAREEKEKTYAMFYDLLPSNAMEIENDTKEKTNNRDGVFKIFPIEVNIKLDSEPSNFWQNGKVVPEINSQLLERIKINKNDVYKLTPREFEEVVAEIYYKMGYDVELTPLIKDGGKDIIIISKDINNPFVHYVECKRYSPTIPVGVGILRELNGVRDMDNVNKGIIVTTSYFTRDAKNEKEEKCKSKLELQPFDELVEKLLR